MEDLTISYSRGKYTVLWTEGYSHTSWAFTADGFNTELLEDILGRVKPTPLFLQAVATQPTLQHPPNPGQNEGLARADRAAREAEIALRNGGSALAQGVAIDAPMYDDKDLKALPVPGDYKPVKGLEEAWAAFKAASDGSDE
jgi:hypothetical protein